MNSNFKKNLKPILLALLFWAGGVGFAQNPDFKKIKALINKGENFEAIKFLEATDFKKLSKADLAKSYFYLGKAYGNENINDISFSYLLESEKAYLAIKSIPNAMEVKIELADALAVQNLYYNTTKEYYREYIAYAEKSKNPKLITHGYYRMATFLISEEPKEAQKYFFKALKFNKITKDEKAYSDIIFNLAALYSEKIIQKDSALYYYKKSLSIAQKHKNHSDICSSLICLASVHSKQKEFNEAIKLLHEAEKVPITLYTKNTKSLIHLYLSSNYNEIGNYQKAYNELSEYQKTNADESFERQNKQITDFQTRYGTQKKELENLSLKVKNRNSLLLVYLFIGLLVIISFIGFFSIKFLNKKKKIAEQEKLIETQKLDNVLKEQELKEIDKLLEGQEKERIKIANDLHDNLGSLMATLKLNFQNLKLKSGLETDDEDNLFDKTDELLEEAYQKVRGIAHTKNAGVIANEGLLPAITNIAKKASIAGRLDVQVVPFGLEERLESMIEVNIFRMVQEIITNAIKHAEASQITIHLTQHHDSLNIIIEDNGKGFNPKHIDKKEGMGLPNIEKKVEHMGGTFTIDSSKGRGTSIIIDIPL